MTVVEKIESLKEQMDEISNEYCDDCQEYCCDQCTVPYKEDNNAD